MLLVCCFHGRFTGVFSSSRFLREKHLEKLSVPHIFISSLKNLSLLIFCSANAKKFSVNIKAAVGELVRPIAIPQTEFVKQQGKRLCSSCKL